MITDLHNPCMKTEHWNTLESVVGTSLNVRELTLADLEEIKMFSYGIEIQEVTLPQSLVISPLLLIKLVKGEVCAAFLN